MCYTDYVTITEDFTLTMNIPAEIIEQVMREEDMKKPLVLFMALSSFRKREIKELTESGDEVSSYIVDKSVVNIDGTGVAYYYQMEPIFHYYLKRKEEIDTVILLGTDKTRIVDQARPEFWIGNTKVSESEESYMERFIKDKFGADTNIVFLNTHDADNRLKKDVTIVSEVIDAIRKSGKDGAIRLSVDIHGGLRDTQMLIQNIITLLHYEGTDPAEYTVHFDVSSKTGYFESVDKVKTIQNFVSGIREFMTYGKSRTLEIFYGNNDNELVNIIREISDSIQLCDIMMFDEAIKAMKRYTDDYTEKGDYSDLFINTIRSSYGELMDDHGRNVVANKVRWCLKNDFIQQALTIIESQMPNDLFQRNVVRYHYDNEQDKKVILYSGSVETGMVKLSDALDKNRQPWEPAINYALRHWMRENVGTLSISGKTDYLNMEINDCSFSKCTTLPYNSNNGYCYINLDFNVSDRINTEEKRCDLARLMMLHLALKEERNLANHARPSSKRTSVEEIRRAIESYIILTDRILECVSSESNK